MVLKTDKEKVKTLLSETIRLLCKNGLHFKNEFCVEALVGIQLDRNEEFFLSIKETVKSDIVSSTADIDRSTKKSHKESRHGKAVKVEAQQRSSCQKKRPAETVTSQTCDGEQSGSLPSLSLGDIQESEQTFWSSVTGGGGESPSHDAPTPKKKRENDDDDEDDDDDDDDEDDDDNDDSNTNVVVKGEPDSDSDLEISGHEPPTITNPNIGGMSGPFAFGPPATTMSGMQPGMMQQVWDQLPQFPSMPGPSAMTSSANTLGSPGGQHQGVHSRPTHAANLVDLDLQGMPMKPGLSPMELKQQRLAQLQQNPLYLPRLMRRVLLTKGREITPKQVYWNFSYRDRPSIALIHQIMKELHSKGLGVYGKSDKRTVFAKKEPWAISAHLASFGITVPKYEKQFYTTTGTTGFPFQAQHLPTYQGSSPATCYPPPPDTKRPEGGL